MNTLAFIENGVEIRTSLVSEPPVDSVNLYIPEIANIASCLTQHSHMSLQIKAAPLSPSSTHPRLHIISSTLTTSRTRQGNQGTSTKTPYIAPCTNTYDTAPSGQAGSPVLSVSRNAPRETICGADGRQTVIVTALERHPYSCQSFTPMGRKADVAFIVVVADGDESGMKPDLTTVEAFTVPGDTGVCYDAGLWHAPMAVIGEVCQAMNSANDRQPTSRSSSLRTESQKTIVRL